MPAHFCFPLRAMAEKLNPERLLYTASLNIMFLTHCKYSNFLASVAANSKVSCGLLSLLLPLRVAHVYLSLT